MPPTPSHTYEPLRDTIGKRMRHVYQPLMLMELLGRRSPAPAQDVARRILVGGWWARASPAMASSAESDAEGDELLQLCRQRTPISGSTKVRVLTRCEGRCECCGAGCCSANPAPAGPLHR